MRHREEIRDLLGRYCEAIDLGRFDDVGALFAEGCLADEHGNELARGAPAVSAFFTAGTQLHDGSPRTKHLVINSIFEDGDDPGSETTSPSSAPSQTRSVVRARSSYLVLQGVEGSALQPIIAGRYHDTFVRSGTQRWQFHERRFLVDLMGDLTRHLAFQL